VVLDQSWLIEQIFQEKSLSMEDALQYITLLECTKIGGSLIGEFEDGPSDRFLIRCEWPFLF